jgi:hypothetical protein
MDALAVFAHGDCAKTAVIFPPSRKPHRLDTTVAVAPGQSVEPGATNGGGV